MSKEILKTKFKAFSIHLMLSFFLVTLLLSAVIYFWFPLEYLGISSFKGVTLLIVGIDLIIGPILTFIVYAPGKKSLKFDLSTIAVFQIIAITYGTFALYQTHPLFVTYKQGMFNLVHANEIDLDKAKFDQLKVSKFSAGNLAFTQLPKDPKEQADIMMGVDMKGEPDIDQRAEFYEPYENHLDTILKNSLDSAELFSEKMLDRPRKKFMEKFKDKDEYAYFPVKGSSAVGIIVLDKKTAQVVTTINSNPWKLTKK